jgi:hypothetical protein
MTRKIVEAGTDTYRATCGECGCRFTYERSDIHTNYVAHVRQVVSCPHCGKDVGHLGAGNGWSRC